MEIDTYQLSTGNSSENPFFCLVGKTFVRSGGHKENVGYEINAEQLGGPGRSGVGFHLKLDHEDIYKMLKEMCDDYPEKMAEIIHGLSGYLTYKENDRKFPKPVVPQSNIPKVMPKLSSQCKKE